MKVDLAPDAVLARLRRASELADLRAERRLDAKLDMSPEGIERRLREVSELFELCRVLGTARP